MNGAGDMTVANALRVEKTKDLNPYQSVLTAKTTTQTTADMGRDVTMAECVLCHRKVLDGQDVIDNGQLHTICDNEQSRRFKNGMCVVCNKNKSGHEGCRCDPCVAINNSNYEGYDKL